MKLKKQKKDEGSIAKKTQRSLRYSILDASFYSAMLGFGESFFSAFAVFLKANTIQLGLLGSLPQALGSISQLFSEKLLKIFNSRKRFVCINAFLQALMYIPIALVFYFGTLKVYHLILFVSLYFVFGMIASPAWNSWIGDLVNGSERGSYFGRRNTIAGFVSFITLLIAGYVLQHFTGETKTQYTGFAIIFILALLFRIISFSYLARKYEPNYIIPKDDGVGFVSFIRSALSKNYGTYIVYLCIMNFSIYLAAPFFAAYMLYDLKLSYVEYTVVIAAAVLAKYFSMPIWGRSVDKFGTKKVLTLSGFLMPAVSVLWLFDKSLLYLILIQIYSGFVWAGFEIASLNFFFDSIIPQRRSKYIAYFNVLNGVALFTGALLGGLIVKYNNVFWSKYFLVFLLSSVFRYLSSIVFIPKLREVRNVDKITYPRLLMNIIANTTTRGLIYDLIMIGKKR